LKFSAANENVKVKTLVLGQTGTMTGADIAAVRLYDKNGVMVAQKAPTAAGHVNMDALNLELTADQATSLFIGIVAKSMNADGDAAGTATYARTCIFNLASQATLASLSLAADKAATAQGIDSGIDVTLVGDVDGGTVAVGQYASTTILTKEAKMTGSVLNSVVNALSDGVLTAGNGKTIGKYTFVFDNGANRTAANEELKAQMVSLALTIATSTGVNVTNVEAYIEGNSTNIATSSIINGVATLDLDSGNGLANTGKVDGTVTLVVTGNIAVTGTTQFVQTEITSLASALTYNGNNGSLADNFTNARLDVSKVSGATLSN
jgi:hypothetical protein